MARKFEVGDFVKVIGEPLKCEDSELTIEVAIRLKGTIGQITKFEDSDDQNSRYPWEVSYLNEDSFPCTEYFNAREIETVSEEEAALWIMKNA